MSAVTNYLDLDLLVEKEGEGYQARVLASPGGQATSTFQSPFSPLELENFLLKVGMSLSEIRRNVRRIDSSDMAEIKSFGARLFRALFDEELQPTLVRSLDEARRRQAGLRLRLRLSDAPELADLPWEYLYDTSANRFLNLSVETPLIRYLELPEPGRPLTVQPPLKILVMISSPSDVARLDVDMEWNRITSAVSDLESRGMVAVERLETATMAALQRTLRRGEYHIFHFVGHGGYDEQTQDGVLVLEGMDGRSRRVSGQDLGTLLHDHRSLRLVVLNSCEGARSSPTDPFAGAAQSLVQQGIPAVIAMQFEITDEAAITLSHEFYSALADGYAVDTALGEARKAIFASGNEVEWGTPVLYMRSNNGRIFRMQPPAANAPGLPAAKAALESPPVSSVPVATPPMASAPVVVPPAEVPSAAPGPITARGDSDPPAVASPESEVLPEPPLRQGIKPAAPAVAAKETGRRSAPGAMATRLSLIGAALLLVGMGLSNGAGMKGIGWFVLEPLLAVAGAAVIGVSISRGKEPWWGGGVLLGLGSYLVLTLAPLVETPDYGFQVGELVMFIGAGLIAGAGLTLWRKSPISAVPGTVGLPSAAGAFLIFIATFLPVTSDGGPKVLTEMGFWVVGSQTALLVPLLLVVVSIFLLSVYPSKRPAAQRGQVLGLGLEVGVFFLAIAGASVTQFWGSGPGLWLALAGAGLVVWGALRPAPQVGPIAPSQTPG